MKALLVTAGFVAACVGVLAVDLLMAVRSYQSGYFNE